MKGLLLSSVLLGALANAEDIDLTWDAPDGSVICTPDPTVPVITEYRMWKLVGSSTTTNLTIPGVLPGDYEYTVTGIANGVESQISNIASKTVVDYKAESGSPVKSVVTVDGRFVLLVVGNLISDADCDTSQTVNGHYSVPTSLVNWTGTARPVTVVAQCQ